MSNQNSNNVKKEYVKPQVEAIELNNDCHLLSGSMSINNETGNGTWNAKDYEFSLDAWED